MIRRETKAERVYFKRKESDMSVDGDYRKERRWLVQYERLEALSVSIDATIQEHNDLATEMGEDIIVAWKMTHEDLDKAIQEAVTDDKVQDDS